MSHCLGSGTLFSGSVAYVFLMHTLGCGLGEQTVIRTRKLSATVGGSYLIERSRDQGFRIFLGSGSEFQVRLWNGPTCSWPRSLTEALSYFF
jgi:hypothetical protein